MERASPSEPRTLFDKLWDTHIVVPESPEAPAMLYVDLHLVHEVTSPQAFAMLDERGLKVRAPQRRTTSRPPRLPWPDMVRQRGTCAPWRASLSSATPEDARPGGGQP